MSTFRASDASAGDKASTEGNGENYEPALLHLAELPGSTRDAVRAIGLDGVRRVSGLLQLTPMAVARAVAHAESDGRVSAWSFHECARQIAGLAVQVGGIVDRQVDMVVSVLRELFEVIAGGVAAEDVDFSVLASCLSLLAGGGKGGLREGVSVACATLRDEQVDSHHADPAHA